MKTIVLITVKTYPTLSTKYNELVCTAGFTEDGKWIRIYHVEFRKKSYNDQYRKYEWIEVDLVKNKKDFRPESFRPLTSESKFVKIGSIGTESNWQKRKEIVLKNVFDDLTLLIWDSKDKAKFTSLAVFKPTEILDFVVEPVAREWPQAKLDLLNQLNIFEPSKKGLNVVRKLPYKFSYKLKDVNGKVSKMMIEDWEIGQLYWNCLQRHRNEEIAVQKVRQKYWDDFWLTKDLHLYLGTTKANHIKGKNPFVIIGTFTPKKDNQIKLF